MAIRGLIFDYGGVLWDMAFGVTRELEREHGLDEHVILRTLYGSERWRKLEVGIGDRDGWLAEAHDDLVRKAGRDVPPLHEHWRASQHLIGPNIDLIRRLRPPYKTAVLSNADNTLLDRITHEHRIRDLFDDIVVSGDVGIAKPDQRIYALSAKRLGLPPEDCVFIDDLETNVEAARAAGMRGIHFLIDQGHDLESQLAALGVRPR